MIHPNVVENHWALQYKRQAVLPVFHQARKHPQNPLIRGQGGYLTVRRQSNGRFRMWYQQVLKMQLHARKRRRYRYAVSYAESTDGLNWKLPSLGLVKWQGNRSNNLVWMGASGRKAAGPYVFIPTSKRSRGNRYEMVYVDRDGIHIVGSKDGLRWDAASDRHISAIRSDTVNSVYFDAVHRQYRMICRPKHVYRRRRGKIINVGASRRVALMSSKHLYRPWKTMPKIILIPDAIDSLGRFNFFYGMPVTKYGGIYWGLLWLFRMNTTIHTEIAWSTTGTTFHRQPGPRIPLIPTGAKGTWDGGMVISGNSWVEQGNEWWLYYAGYDGSHRSKTRSVGIGLATIRKEGFVSLRGPVGGGVVTTYPLRWPGGGLYVNANATGGRLMVRVLDSERKVLPGMRFADAVELRSDGVRQRVRWNGGDIVSLKDKIIRLEFFLKRADLYAFVAGAP